MERINVDLINICLNSEIKIRDKSIKPKKSAKDVRDTGDGTPFAACDNGDPCRLVTMGIIFPRG